MKGWIRAVVTALIISTLSGCVSPPKPAASGYGADLVITETADRKSVEVGGRITFIITVTNRGPNEASGIIFGSPVPVALDYIYTWCSDGTQTGSVFCELDHLPSGKSAIARIVATPIGNPNSDELSLNNRALIAEYIAFDPDKSNNSTSVTVHILPETLGSGK